MTEPRRPHERPSDDERRWIDTDREERIDKSNVGWNRPTERERPEPDDDD